MYFLISYDRKKSDIVELRRFEDAQQVAAMEARLELELRANALGLDHEIVILQAASEDTVRRTHARYFKSLEELVEDFRDALDTRPGVAL